MIETDNLEAVAQRLFMAAADRHVPNSVQDALRHVAREMLGARGAVGGFWAREVADILSATGT